MKSLSRILLCIVLLSGLALQPSWGADEPAALVPAAPAAPDSPAVQPLPLSSLLAPEPAAAARVGMVDMERVSSESAMGKAAQARVKEQQQKMQKELDARKARLDKMRADIEKQMPTLQPPQREARIKEFQKKADELQSYGQKAEKELKTTRDTLTREFLAAVEGAAVEIGRERKLAAVLIKGDVLYLDGAVELQEVSDDLVARMNAKGEKK